jgi:hypothetical protein
VREHAHGRRALTAAERVHAVRTSVGAGSIWDLFSRVPSNAYLDKSQITVPSGPVAPSIV